LIENRCTNVPKIPSIFAFMRRLLLPLLTFFCILSFGHTSTGQVVMPKYKKGKWGLYTKWNKKVVDCIYDEIKEDNVSRQYHARKGTQWGAFNKVGTAVIPCEYESIEYYKTGLYKLQKNGKYGLFFARLRKNGKYWLYNVLNDAQEFIYEDIDQCDSLDTNFKVKRNGKYGLINELGEATLPFEYDTIKCMETGSYVLSKDRKLRFIKRWWI